MIEKLKEVYMYDIVMFSFYKKKKIMENKNFKIWKCWVKSFIL